MPPRYVAVLGGRCVYQGDAQIDGFSLSVSSTSIRGIVSRLVKLGPVLYPTIKTEDAELFISRARFQYVKGHLLYPSFPSGAFCSRERYIRITLYRARVQCHPPALARFSTYHCFLTVPPLRCIKI